MSNFLRTGMYNWVNGVISYRSSGGYWWSDIANVNSFSSRLLTDQTNVIPQSSHYRGYGFAIRCVTREGQRKTLPTKDNYVNLITTTYGITNSSAGSTKLRSSPLDFAYTGYYSTSGSLSNETTYGYFWSRTVNGSSDAYLLYFRSSNVNPQSTSFRGNGFPLRCTAKQGRQQAIFITLFLKKR